MENKKLLTKLVCPDCQGKLILGKSALDCPKCKQRFSVKENIPIFYDQSTDENGVVEEYEYWNKKTNTPENLYENMLDSVFQELIRTFNIPDKTRGLELGCGDGPFARRLKNKNLDIYGVDISFSLLKLTEHMLPVQGNALKLPFKDNFFHWIIYAFALHHMPDPQKALKEAIRVLDENARIFIVDPNYYHPVRFFTRKPGMFLRRHVFRYLSPEEKWIPLYRIKNILKENNVMIQHVSFLTPEFSSSSFIGKIQKILAKLFNFKPFR
ncbi:MAG: methyltransferase domain-containing protein, partial [bacterium]